MGGCSFVFWDFFSGGPPWAKGELTGTATPFTRGCSESLSVIHPIHSNHCGRGQQHSLHSVQLGNWPKVTRLEGAELGFESHLLDSEAVVH